MNRGGITLREREALFADFAAGREPRTTRTPATVARLRQVYERERRA